MAKFLGPLVYQRLTSKWVLLVEDLTFEFTLREVMTSSKRDMNKIADITGLDPDEKIYIVAPKGFVTDLASVPKTFHWLFKPDGKYAPAAVLHDLIYQSLKSETDLNECPTQFELLTKYHTRLFADKLFRKAMYALNINRASVSLIYSSVRLGGKSSYGGRPVIDPYGVILVREPHAGKGMYPIFRGESTKGLPDEATTLVTKRYAWHLLKYKNLKRPFLLEATMPHNVKNNVVEP